MTRKNALFSDNGLMMRGWTIDRKKFKIIVNFLERFIDGSHCGIVHSLSSRCTDKKEEKMKLLYCLCLNSVIGELLRFFLETRDVFKNLLALLPGYC